MIEINVTINGKNLGDVSVFNVGKKVFGQTVYLIEGQRFKSFHVLHTPKTGLAVLLRKVFDHIAVVDRWTDTPTTEEEW